MINLYNFPSNFLVSIKILTVNEIKILHTIYVAEKGIIGM